MSIPDTTGLGSGTRLTRGGRSRQIQYSIFHTVAIIILFMVRIVEIFSENKLLEVLMFSLDCGLLTTSTTMLRGLLLLLAYRYMLLFVCREPRSTLGISLFFKSSLPSLILKNKVY